LKSFIYLIYAETDSVGQWKLGVTKRDINERLKEHTVSNPNIVGVVAMYETDSNLSYSIESVLKRWYRKDKIRGEWITYDGLTKEKFLNDCSKIEKNLKFIKNNSTFI
jgi:predicted GIY-YIG superfamily endonuclease